MKKPKSQKWHDAMAKKRGTTARNQYTKAKELGLPVPSMSEEGKEKIRFASKNRKHSEETKKKISEKALSSSHRRLKKNTIKYVNRNNEEIVLDSTWEYYLATKLDELKIDWVRPEPIKWVDSSGKKRNYFPDFYLPNHDLYIDPKNPAAYNSQIEKIHCLQTQLTNLVILKSIKEIDEFIENI